jgi:hypothetical protein
MLGKFLELSLYARDTGTSWQQLRQLGFADVETGDIFTHTYGVVACEQLAIGLHAKQDEPLCISFVRPDVAALHRLLTEGKQPVEFAKLSSDSFNLLALREPGGMQLKVLEARSFSPPLDPPNLTRLGLCIGLSLPCRDLEAATEFWSRLGYASNPITEPWEGLAIEELPIRYHLRRLLPEPVVLFERSAALATDELDDTGLTAERSTLQPERGSAQLYRTHDELAILTILNPHQS